MKVDIFILPSITVSFYESRGLSNLHEERHLVLLNLLKNKGSRIIFVMSSELDAGILFFLSFFFFFSFFFILFFPTSFSPFMCSPFSGSNFMGNRLFVKSSSWMLVIFLSNNYVFEIFDFDFDSISSIPIPISISISISIPIPFRL
jgi:hypothetical protein